MDGPGGGDDKDGPQFGTLLAGLAVAAFLVVLGLFIIDRLKAMSDLQDCAMSGRRNCAPLSIETK
ncbi:MAG TPA: hypothetical protein VEK12_11885 [Alphaproteobacteria bacterium]|nr:hypothetical protein [Alphaproteobacteria bacterium]